MLSFPILTLVNLVLGAPLLPILFARGTAITFLFVLFCVLRNWLDFLPACGMQVDSCICRQLKHYVWGLNKCLDKNAGCTFFEAWDLLSVAHSWENCLSLSFLAIFRSHFGLGKMVTFVISQEFVSKKNNLRCWLVV